MRITTAFLLLSVCICSAQMPETLLMSIQNPPSGGAPFSPSDISGMQLWFKGESFAGFSEWASVSNWPSSAPSYGTRYATNADSTEWPKLTNTFGTKVGTNALWFDANVAQPDHLHVSNALAYSKNIASCSLILVGHVIADSNEKICFYVAKGTDVASTRHVLKSTADEFIYTGGRTADADSFVQVSNNVAVSSPIIMQADFLHSDGDLKLYTNGTLASQNTSWQDNENTSNTDSLGVMIGYSTTSPWSGWIAEVIVYVPAISDGDRANLTTHLKAKFGL